MTTKELTDDEVTAIARPLAKAMHVTDMRELIESIGTTSTSGMKKSELVDRLVSMALAGDWLPDELLWPNANWQEPPEPPHSA